MWMTILAGALLLTAPPQQPKDSTFAVDPRARLRMEGVRGDVVIHTWDRPEMRVHTSGADDARLRVDAGASFVRVGLERAEGYGPAESGDFELTIPATMPIGIGGQSADVTIDGSRAEVNVGTVQGDIRVLGGTGVVTLRTVQGDITLTGARGHIDVHSVGGDLHLADVAGDLLAETISGDASVRGADLSSAQITSVNGDVSYDGSVQATGHYVLNTHSGDVAFSLPPGVGATISVSTFNGDFIADVPVQLTEQRRGRNFTFSLGTGSARVELQSFSGDIRLARPGFSGTARH